MATLQEQVAVLVTQTTDMLATNATFHLGLEARIAAAVLASKNAALIPLVIMATATINTQRTVVNLLTPTT